MSKHWFQLSEQGAGYKRLVLTKYIYNLFGEFPLRIITFFVVLFVFLTAKIQRRASIKYFKILKKKFVIFHSFKHFLSYGNSLADKLISFLGRLNPNKFELKSTDIFSGAFFITTHLGNVEILRSLFQSENFCYPKRVNVFLQSNACEIFNNFLKTLEIKLNIEVFPVEEIDVTTSILISERLKNGEIVFMAGDRISAQNENKVYEKDFLGHSVKFPLGTLKFALLMNAPIYFITCIKENKKYKVFTEQFITNEKNRNKKLEELGNKYVKFLEKYTLKYPYQLYNFFDFMD